MNSSVVYLIERLFYRIFEFLRHWYVRSIRVYSNFILVKFERLDRRFAFVVTLKNLFQPMYKDYTIIGYIFGFTFRFIRLIVVGIFYTVFFSIAVIFYLIWLVVPPILFLSALGW